MRLFTSLATRPRPASPQWMRFAGSPMASSTGVTRSRASGSPPTMTARVPASAPGGPPLRGQSRYATPRRRQSSANARATAGAMVLVSTITGGGVDAESIAPTTSRTSSESVTHDMPTSAPSTAAAMDSARRAGTPLTRSGCRAYRRTVCPAASRLRTMPAPMRPAPTKPISIAPLYRRRRAPSGEGRQALHPGQRGSRTRQARAVCPTAEFEPRKSLAGDQMTTLAMHDERNCCNLRPPFEGSRPRRTGGIQPDRYRRLRRLRGEQWMM